jgi:putative redox protein
VSSISVALLGRGDCSIVHSPSGAVIASSKSTQFGGSGASFSSTDLLAAALGSCIATDLEPVAERHGVALADIRIVIGKELTITPKRIVSLRVSVTLPDTVAEDVMLRLERAAQHCLVHRSLHTDIDVVIDFQRAG